MASKRHQFILGLIVRKMREEGYDIHNIDGDYPGLLGDTLPIPPLLMRHRPDAFGISKDGQICIGEAKTESDLSSERTYEQLLDFTSIILNQKKCQVFIGVPQSAEMTFKKKLQSTGLINCDNIHVIYVPNKIINE